VVPGSQPLADTSTGHGNCVSANRMGDVSSVLVLVPMPQGGGTRVTAPIRAYESPADILAGAV